MTQTTGKKSEVYVVPRVSIRKILGVNYFAILSEAQMSFSCYVGERNLHAIPSTNEYPAAALVKYFLYIGVLGQLAKVFIPSR